MSNKQPLSVDDFWAALSAMPAPEPVFYRLYHDSDGYPVAYSMDDIPGLYVEIDQTTYNANNKHIRVVDGKIVTQRFKHKLLPSFLRSNNVYLTNHYALIVPV